MQTVGIKSLKNRLSAYIRAASSGETVLVTDRGRVVAEIVAPRVAADAPPTEQKWAGLVRSGVVTPARASAQERLPPRRKRLKPLRDVLHDLDADRSER